MAGYRHPAGVARGHVIEGAPATPGTPQVFQQKTGADMSRTDAEGSLANADPRDLILHSDMSTLQVVVVGITILLNALDGFDVLSISFASPGIAAEWGIDRAALGFVLSMELIGMGLGSIVLGGVADTIGRKPTVLGCLVVMAVGMLAA